jgi:cytochrome P450 family 26 subfamily A
MCEPFTPSEVHHHHHHRDLLSHLVTYTDEHGNGFSDTEIKDNILLLIFAGHDTTTTVATMTCKYLASNPSIMDDVYKGSINRFL